MAPKRRLRGKQHRPPTYALPWHVAASTVRRNHDTKEKRLAQAGKYFTWPNCCASVRVLDTDLNAKKVKCPSCTLRASAGSFRQKAEIPDSDVHAYNEFEHKYSSARFTALESTTRADFDKQVNSLNQIATDGHSECQWLPEYILFAWSAAEREDNRSDTAAGAPATQSAETKVASASPKITTSEPSKAASQKKKALPDDDAQGAASSATVAAPSASASSARSSTRVPASSGTADAASRFKKLKKDQGSEKQQFDL